MKRGGGRKVQSEPEKMKTRGIEWRRFYEEEDDGSLGCKLRLLMPATSECTATTIPQMSSDAVSHEGKELHSVHAVNALHMAIGISL